MRRDVELEKSLHDGGRHGVVAAAGAQCRHDAFVVADGEFKLVLLQARMRDPWLGDITHILNPMFVSGGPALCRFLEHPIDDEIRADRHTIIVQHRHKFVRIGSAIQYQKRFQLGVAVLFQNVYAFVLLDEVHH